MQCDDLIYEYTVKWLLQSTHPLPHIFTMCVCVLRTFKIYFLSRCVCVCWEHLRSTFLADFNCTILVLMFALMGKSQQIYFGPIVFFLKQYINIF